MVELKSVPVDWVGEEHHGFVINAAFSQLNADVITIWLDNLAKAVDEGIYIMKPQGLHITVLDWVAPLFDYNGADKVELYKRLRPSYNEAFVDITNNLKSFDVHFTEVRITPGAIILVGHDNGQFQSLRTQFIDKVVMPAGSKQPPTIVHSTMVRFISPQIELSPLEEYVHSHPIDLTQHVNAFRLVETRREPMQDFTVIDTYNLLQ